VTCCVADTEEEETVVGFGQSQSLRAPNLPRHRVVHMRSDLSNNQNLSVSLTMSDAHIRASALTEPVAETKLVTLLRPIRSTGRHREMVPCGKSSA